MPRANKKTAGHTFTRVCPVCEQEFTTDNPRTKYCTMEHKRHAANERYYQRHANQVSQSNNERQKEQRRRLAELENSDGS